MDGLLINLLSKSGHITEKSKFSSLLVSKRESLHLLIQSICYRRYVFKYMNEKVMEHY